MFDQYTRPVKVAVAVTLVLVLAVVLATVVLMQRGIIGGGKVGTSPSGNTGQPYGKGSVMPAVPTGDNSPQPLPPVVDIKQDPGAPNLLTPEEVLKERGITVTPPPAAPMTPPAAPAAPAVMPTALPAAPSVAPSAPGQQ